MKRHRKFRYDYYRVELPADILEDRAEIAIAVADDYTRLWCSPAEWRVLSDDGKIVVVRRKRRNIKMIVEE